jgi:hypothetical protein
MSLGPLIGLASAALARPRLLGGVETPQPDARARHLDCVAVDNPGDQLGACRLGDEARHEAGRAQKAHHSPGYGSGRKRARNSSVSMVKFQ